MHQEETNIRRMLQREEFRQINCDWFSTPRRAEIFRELKVQNVEDPSNDSFGVLVFAQWRFNQDGPQNVMGRHPIAQIWSQRRNHHACLAINRLLKIPSPDEVAAEVAVDAERIARNHSR